MNAHMRIARTSRVVSGAMVVLALLLGVGPASAHETETGRGSAPDNVSGTFTAPPPMPVSVREAGGNCFAEIPDDVFVLDGALEGELVLDFRIHFHNPCSAIGFPADFYATGTFTGSAMVGAMRRSGSFVVVFSGQIDEQPLARGRAAISHGTGGFEGLHGVLDMEGVPGVGGTYTGRVHLDSGM